MERLDFRATYVLLLLLDLPVINILDLDAFFFELKTLCFLYF